MTLKSIMIVKDSTVATQLSKNIANNSSIELMQSSPTPISMISRYASAIDVIFFEVTENNLTDFEIILKFSSQIKSIVLIVGNEGHGIKNRNLSDIEFLFRPITSFHFDIVIEKIGKNIPAIIQQKFMAHGDFLIKDILKKERIRCYYGEVTVIEVTDKSLKIHTISNGIIESNIPLKRIQEWLNPIGIFYRVHKSFIISSEYVKGITGDSIRMEYYKQLIKMGAHYRKDFDEYIASITIPKNS